MADDVPKNVPGRWVGLDDLAAVAANQFMFQVDHVGTTPDGVVLTFGQAKIPPVIGTIEQKRAILEAIEYVPVRALASFQLTETRLNELIDLLIKQRDEVFGAPATDEATPPAEGKGAEA